MIDLDACPPCPDCGGLVAWQQGDEHLWDGACLTCGRAFHGFDDRPTWRRHATTDMSVALLVEEHGRLQDRVAELEEHVGSVHKAYAHGRQDALARVVPKLEECARLFLAEGYTGRGAALLAFAAELRDGSAIPPSWGARHRAEERARIVAWLRAQNDTSYEPPISPWVLVNAADAIERGEHG